MKLNKNHAILTSSSSSLRSGTAGLGARGATEAEPPPTPSHPPCTLALLLLKLPRDCKYCWFA